MSDDPHNDPVMRDSLREKIKQLEAENARLMDILEEMRDALEYGKSYGHYEVALMKYQQFKAEKAGE